MLHAIKVAAHLAALSDSTKSAISSIEVHTVSQSVSSPSLLRLFADFLNGGSCLYSLQSSLLNEK